MGVELKILCLKTLLPYKVCGCVVMADYAVVKTIKNNCTVHGIWCHLLFGSTQCCDYLLLISLFTKEGQIGCLETIEHKHLHVVKFYILTES